MAMYAILAIVADDERAIVDIGREADRNKLISCFIYITNLGINHIKLNC